MVGSSKKLQRDMKVYNGRSEIRVVGGVEYRSARKELMKNDKGDLKLYDSCRERSRFLREHTSRDLRWTRWRDVSDEVAQLSHIMRRRIRVPARRHSRGDTSARRCSTSTPR